ncbi:hypothetical protein CERZMDRAFT_81273 [Cercospora zeae-maydis SCOH1-5]|uniref:Uncharacterized protein n=1 Tax=Cercospora zeae-maydis SCOH1-5 TaxID=717836 RepID=A0A6A6FVA2_9PEZI|nr:hypothetical protein CERZMDRAFT_81273 [Cercospora zeae-maydis SCOH1-5]
MYSISTNDDLDVYTQRANYQHYSGYQHPTIRPVVILIAPMHSAIYILPEAIWLIKTARLSEGARGTGPYGAVTNGDGAMGKRQDSGVLELEDVDMEDAEDEEEHYCTDPGAAQPQTTGIQMTTPPSTAPPSTLTIITLLGCPVPHGHVISTVWTQAQKSSPPSLRRAQSPRQLAFRCAKRNAQIRHLLASREEGRRNLQQTRTAMAVCLLRGSVSTIRNSTSIFGKRNKSSISCSQTIWDFSGPTLSTASVSGT